jgi:phosphate transport system permease protein
MLLADPQLLGTRVEVWVPADDELDMLIKGHTTDIDRETGRGILSLVGNDEEVTLLSTSNDFSNILQDVKRSIGRDADRSERKLERLQNNLSDAEKALTGLEERMLEARNDPLQNAGRIQALEEQLADARARIDNYRHRIGQEEATFRDLRSRADNLGGAERLTREMPSYLVQVNGGMIKLTSISNTEAIGRVLSPLQSMEDAQQTFWWRRPPRPHVG